MPTSEGLLTPGDLKKLTDEIEMAKAREALEHRRKQAEEEAEMKRALPSWSATSS